ncbi:hypothetical protein VTL71DRAFT_677 [Oculimacula yallundae]|uniref:Uncharacterized protein n=1 Tax=Oculimacula yallundae TaxID=86028 RepID=A0ABR4D0T6_9HELO
MLLRNTPRLLTGLLSLLIFYSNRLLQILLSQILSPQLLSRGTGIVLSLLVFQALAEYLFFYTFDLAVSVVEQAFRGVFNFAWWILVTALAVLISLQVYMVVDTADMDLLRSNEAGTNI